MLNQLIITIPIQLSASAAGQSYVVQGWLADKSGNPVALSTSREQVLAAGNSNISLVFDGKVLAASGRDGPYSLVDVQVVKAGSGEVVYSVDVAYKTAVYNHADFVKP